MTRFAGPPVLVTPDPLGTRLGGTADTVGTESVPLPGAVAHVDPAAPWAPPAVTVLDLTAAAETLDELWGPHAVDLVAGGGEGQLDLDLAGPGLGALQDLGTARWLRRWQPYPLDPGLLLLDVLRSRARCEHLLQTSDEDEDGLDGRLSGGLDLTTALELASRVESTLRAAPDGPDAPPWVTSLGRPRAAVASATTLLRMQGSASADWDRVPVGTVTRAESGLHWSVETIAGATTLHVLSPAVEPALPHPLSPLLPDGGADELRFRLYAPGWPLPLVEGVLARVGDADSWAGSVPLSSEAAHRAHQAGPRQVLVDVLRPGLSTPPRTGPRALRARARRWGVRAVAAGRLAAGRLAAPEGGSPLLTESRSAVRQAVSTWTALGATDEAGLLTRWSPAAAGTGRRTPDPGLDLGLAERWSLVRQWEA